MKIKNDKMVSIEKGVNIEIVDIDKFVIDVIKHNRYNIENPFDIFVSSGAVSFKCDNEYTILLDKKILRFLSKRMINKLISHEMGHIKCGHFEDNNILKSDLEKEIEADNYSIENGKGIFNLYTLVIANIFRWTFCKTSYVPHSVKHLILHMYKKFIFNKTVFIRMKNMTNLKRKQCNKFNKDYYSLIAC